MKLAFNRALVALFLVVSLGFAFTSCAPKRDDPGFAGGESGVNVDPALVGLWTLKRIQYIGEVNNTPPPFSIALAKDGTFTVNNPNGIDTPAVGSGKWSKTSGAIKFEPGISVRYAGGGNNISMAWSVSKPGKTTSTYTYYFERN